ncbi:polyprotein [Broad bean true mosaic virus]|uniref:RNA1 polyprotein n=5 Tax=Broad bean true mosaic virus TaxID=649890 RepID=D7PPR0_9SECO|nr:polyprotein [Broad bean true mosaic virus]ADI60054.1 polyprotein [Broad bean true mosaic virus]
MYTLVFKAGQSVAEIISQVRCNEFMQHVVWYSKDEECHVEDITYTSAMNKVKKDVGLVAISCVALALEINSGVLCDIEYPAVEFLYERFTVHCYYLTSHKHGYRDLMEFNKAMFLKHLNAELTLTGELPVLEKIPVMEAQGLKNFVSGVANWIPLKIKGMVGWTVDAILDSFRNYFNKLIEEKIPMAARVCSWVTTVWAKLVEWIKSSKEAMVAFFAGCEELLTWGLATMVAACALGVLEQILLHTNIISESYNLAEMFLQTGVVAVACYNFHSASRGFAELMRILGVTVAAVSLVIARSFSHRHGTKKITTAQGPIDMLETISNSLGASSQASLVTVGRSCTAINAIATSVGHLKNFAGKILSLLRDFAWENLGLEARFLTDASLIFGEDVDGWLKGISALKDAFIAKSYCNQDEMLEMNILLERGYTMRKSMVAQMRITPAISNMILKGIEDLEKLHRTSSVQGVKGVRKMPFTIFCHGGSRCGKSLLVNKLVCDFQEKLGLGEDTAYARNMNDPYWSGYRRQPIVTVDDFGAVRGDISAEAQLINLVSSSPYPLSMASIEEKGMAFDSQFIFCSTNFLEVDPEAGVRDDIAFKNRRHILVTVSLKQGEEYNPNDFTSNQIYEVKKFVHDRYQIIHRFESYSDFLAFCFTKHEQHVEEQNANLVGLMRKSVFSSHFGKFEQILQLGTFLSDAPNLMAQAQALTAEEEYYHLYSVPRGNTYFHVAANLRKEIQCWEGPVLDSEKEVVLRDSENKLIGAYEFLLLSKELNVVIHNHLQELVCVDNYDRNLNFVGTIVDAHYHQQLVGNIASLKPWHRAILYGIGCLMERTKKATWYETMWNSIKEVLYTAYKTEIADWPVPLKVIVGIVLAGVAGSAFWQVFETLKHASGGGTLVGAAMAGFSTVSAAEAQSRKPNRHDQEQHRYRNVPLTRRNWATAQMSLHQSSVAIMSKCNATFVMGSSHIQITLVPGRRFIGYSHFFKMLGNYSRMVRIVTDKRSYYHHYQPENMEFIKDSELCVYTSSSLEDISHSCWDLFCWDPEKDLPKKFKADFVCCKWDKNAGTYNPTYADINVSLNTEPLVIMDGEYQQKVPVSLAYKAPTITEDCGSMIIAEIGGKRKLVGIHVAGRDGEMGFAALLPPLEPIAQAQGAEKHFDFFPFVQEAQKGVSMVGTLKPGLYVPTPTKTSLVETPVEWHLETPCDKIPSVLVKGDERLKGTEHEEYDPFWSGINKYAEPMDTLDSVLLNEVAQDIVEEWFDCAGDEFDFGEVSIDEALNGIEAVDYMDRIPLATSEGFPHVLSRKNGEKGKRRFVEGDGHVVNLIPGTSVHEAYLELCKTIEHSVPELVGIECPKDEKLPMRKIFSKPKTRCFTILPMEYNILVRQLFLRFVRFIMKSRDKLSCQVGINPYSLEWSGLAARLKKNGDNILCCDYSSFDGLLSKQVMEVMANMINTLCKGDEATQRKRKNLLMACCSRIAICKDKVWKVECGIPSGFPLTVICNSIFNEILVRYYYKRILKRQNAPSFACRKFNQSVTLVTYGDDNLISVNAVIKPYFDGTKLKHEMASQGIIITDGKDKTSATLSFRKLEECDFLKRGFKKRSSVRMDSPEDENSLWAQLHYVNVNNCEQQEAYLTNLRSVLRELYMHDPKEMVDFRRKAIAQIPWIQSQDLPTSFQLREFYAEQREMNCSDPGGESDLLTSVDLLGPALIKQGRPEPVLKITEKYEVVDLAQVAYDRETTKNEVWLLFNVGYPQSSLPKGHHVVTWTVGTGRGGLPTQSWMSLNVARRESHLNKVVRTAFKEGKTIKFAVRSNVIPVNLVAFLFAVRNDIVQVDTSNAVLSNVISQSKSLNYLTDECEFAFFSARK